MAGRSLSWGDGHLTLQLGLMGRSELSLQPQIGMQALRS